MTANLCVVCGRPTPDGFACVAETEQARQQLAEIAELVAPARDVAHRQTSGDGTGGAGVPGSRVPLDLAAGARLDAVQVALTGWARVVAEERNVGVVPGGRDVIVVAAQFLAANLEWLRHKDYVDDVLREIGDCVQAMRSVTAGRRERIYLGTCGALVLTPEPWEPGTPASTECEGSVYGWIGASKAVCKACGARYDQEARITERAEKAHSHWYTAAEIAAAYPGVVLAGTIRKWRQRGLLTVHGEVDGHRLYQVAEVLALVESTKERQAGQGRRETAEMGA
jgi:hypothetical protein